MKLYPLILSFIILLPTDPLLTSVALKFIKEVAPDLPQEVYLDNSQPIDEGEDILVNEKLLGNLFSNEDNIPFDKLPIEVQKVIRLTTNELYSSSKFHLSVIISADPMHSNRGVKSYIYSPLIFNKSINAVTLGTHQWTFNYQNQTLKLAWYEN